MPLDAALSAEVDALVAATGHTCLEQWAGVENYELRLREGRIDRFVLERLRAAAGR